MILGGLADDLTGGLELAAMLVAEGVSTLLATSPSAARSIGTADAVVIAQKTRIAPATEARALFEAGATVLRTASSSSSTAPLSTPPTRATSARASTCLWRKRAASSPHAARPFRSTNVLCSRAIFLLAIAW